LTGAVEQFARGATEWYELFRHQHQRDDSYLAEWRHFMNCVSEQEAPLISGDDGLRVVKIIEAARQAAESRCQVQITDMTAILKAPA
jgi:predicted dehydrogenase